MRQTSGPLSPTCLKSDNTAPTQDPQLGPYSGYGVGVSTPDLHLPITSQQALHSSPSDRLELRAYRLQPQWPIENPSENPEPVQLSAAAWQSSNHTKDQPASVELTVRCCVHSEEEPGVGTGKGSDCQVWPQGDCHRDVGPLGETSLLLQKQRPLVTHGTQRPYLHTCALLQQSAGIAMPVLPSCPPHRALTWRAANR